jgi:polyhydroxyalkanoate synthesis regulator phasin
MDESQEMASMAMDGGEEVASAAADEGREVASEAARAGRETAEAARRDARELADTAKEQVSEISQEVVDQGRGLLEETRTQLEDQANTQVEQLAQTVRRLGAQTQALAEGRTSEAGGLPGYLENVSGRLEGWADDLEVRGVDGLVDDLKTFARRRPGVFLLGATAVGFGVGRLVRAQSDDDQSDEGYDVEELPPARVAPARSRRTGGATAATRRRGRAGVR